MRGVIREVFHPPLFSTPPWRPLNTPPPKSQDRCCRGVQDAVRQGPLGGCCELTEFPRRSHRVYHRNSLSLPKQCSRNSLPPRSLASQRQKWPGNGPKMEKTENSLENRFRAAAICLPSFAPVQLGAVFHLVFILEYQPYFRLMAAFHSFHTGLV